MIVRLPFGNDTRAVDLRGVRVRALQPSGRSGSPDPAGLAANALDRPLNVAPLVQMAEKRASAVVVVPDSTRACELDRILPEVLGRIRQAGIPDRRVTVLVACGTHPGLDEKALRIHLGPVPESITVLQHNARDSASLVSVGRLSEGLDIRLNGAALEADLLITIGAVRHHYFAGFGGGPKMVFPGIAGYEEIQANHSLVLDVAQQPPRREPNCEPGVLAGNPVADQIVRAAALRPPDLTLCLVPGVGGGISEAFAGNWESAWAAAIARVQEGFELDRQEFDLVVASGGGAPCDSTLIQAHKGLDAACRFVRPGGEVLYVAEMGLGMGSADMAPFLADPQPDTILSILADRWVQYGHTTLRIVEKTGRCRVHLVSDLASDLAEGLGFMPARSADEVVDSWRDRFEGAIVGVLTGPAVYPRRG